MKRLIHTAVLAAALAFALLLCGRSGAETSHKAPQRAAVESGERQFAQPSDGDFIAIFSTSLGEVRAVLYPDAAPMAVQNFVGLARSGYYDNTVIWRAQYGFAVQGGDAGGTGSGGATIWSNNPYPLDADSSLRHYAGALCAAFSGAAAVRSGSAEPVWPAAARPHSGHCRRRASYAVPQYSQVFNSIHGPPSIVLRLSVQRSIAFIQTQETVYHRLLQIPSGWAKILYCIFYENDIE